MIDNLLIKGLQPRLFELEADLLGMRRRLDSLANASKPSHAWLAEVAAIYNNLSYLFLYLESNAAHVDHSQVIPLKATFFEKPLRSALLGHLAALSCEDAEAESLRVEYLEFLSDRFVKEDRSARELRAAEGAFVEAIASVRLAETELLTRLGRAAPKSGPTVFYKMIASEMNASRRSKFIEAWNLARRDRLSDLGAAADRLTLARSHDSRSRGFASAREETFGRTRIETRDAEIFLNDSLREAMLAHARLAREVEHALGGVSDPISHFPRFVRLQQGGQPVPDFGVEDCIAFICAVARRTFDLIFERSDSGRSSVMSVDVRREGERMGTIHFDLWENVVSPKSANVTIAARNHMDWAGFRQLPVAYVSCRFRRRPDGRLRISFQNVHSLFHEFGHALNHLLARRRMPNSSGLEHLPLERLEILSMWFERWAFHPSFAAQIAISEDERRGIDLCKRIKVLEYRRTHVDRAVTASIDFLVNGAEPRSLGEAFRDLDRDYGIRHACAVTEFAQYFNLPMLRANPGGYFAYLWGAARSAATFSPLMQLGLEELPAPSHFLAQFANCFDETLPSDPPDPKEAIRFYEPEAVETKGQAA